MEKSLVIGAGGTGGHMFPASAFAEEIRRRGWRVGLVSDVRGLRFAENFPADWKLEILASSPQLKKPWTLPGTALKIQRGIARCKQALADEAVSFAIGFGGYPAFPLLAAARRKAVPLALHEQNAVLGRVNRQFARHAEFVASGFDILERLPVSAKSKHIVTGNPVRRAILEKKNAAFDINPNEINIFITGGSQGTRLFGEVIPSALSNHLSEALKAKLHVFQQVRPEQTDSVNSAYAKANIKATIKPFFDDMPERLSQASIIIARAGAGTISEIAMVGRPSILIPLKIAMDNHQVANAQTLNQRGAALMIEEDVLTAQKLGAILNEWLNAPDYLSNKAKAAFGAAHLSAQSVLADRVEAVFST